MTHRRDDTRDEFMELGEACTYTPDGGSTVPTQCMEQRAQAVFAEDDFTVIGREDRIAFLRADVPEPLRNAIVVVTDALDGDTRTYKIDSNFDSDSDTVTMKVTLQK